MQHYGLIGHPLGHSFSASYFNEKFAVENIDAHYELIDIADINTVRDVFLQKEYNGLNVTIPYKSAIVPFLDELDPTAENIGAVNCVKIIKTGDKKKFIGYNTDTIGFRNTLIPHLNACHTHALILGNGGASKAVQYTLEQLGIGYTIVSRKRGHDIEKQTTKKKVITYDQLSDNLVSTHTLIINTTPVGMFPDTNQAPILPYHILTSQHLVYDLVYNPFPTRLLQIASKQGANTVGGIAMLYAQADAAWQIWVR